MMTIKHIPMDRNFRSEVPFEQCALLTVCILKHISYF